MVGISKLEKEREALKGSLDRAMEAAEAKAEVGGERGGFDGD